MHPLMWPGRRPALWWPLPPSCSCLLVRQQLLQGADLAAQLGHLPLQLVFGALHLVAARLLRRQVGLRPAAAASVCALGGRGPNPVQPGPSQWGPAHADASAPIPYITVHARLLLLGPQPEQCSAATQAATAACSRRVSSIRLGVRCDCLRPECWCCDTYIATFAALYEQAQFPLPPPPTPAPLPRPTAPQSLPSPWRTCRLVL